jgi:hypothetical protein
LFLILDISAVTPLMIHSIKLVVRPDLCSNFAKQIDLDVNKNIVVVKMKNSDVLVIQLIAKRDHCSIIEKIPFIPSDDSIS